MASGKVEIAKELWNIWDIRVLILLSLLIQVLLTFLAPLRKRSSSGLLKLILWLLYLSASGIALYIISQISGSPNDSTHKIDLLAFWAPFLLLHLGGPDTITALALEDNELWHRHALELATQVGITLYVFSNSVNRRKSQLWVPTALMFVDGCIKYFERTQALYFASIESFRGSLGTDPEPGPNFARIMQAYNSSATANIPTTIQGRDNTFADGNYNVFIDSTANNNGENNDIPIEDTDKMIRDAYHFYNKFKGVIEDDLLSFQDRKESRDVFLTKKGPEVLRMIEIEVNLIYDAFYTKAFLLDSKQAYLRVISYLAAIASLVFFSLLDKSHYNEVDVVITYILLGGAVALDLSAGFMLVLSDWYIIINSRHIRLKKWQAYISTTLLKLSRFGRRPGRKRWSRSISQYSLLYRCFKDPPYFFKYLGLRRIKDGLIGMLYIKSDSSKVPQIVNFILEEFKKKAELAYDDDLRVNKEVCSARGNLVLEDDYYLIADYLQPWTTDVDYDESVLTWHLATDICYYTSTGGGSVDQDTSKGLSDYMAYLLLQQKALVSTVVGMSEKRFEDTCAEARKFLRNKRMTTYGTDICLKVKKLIYKMLFLQRGESTYYEEIKEKETKFVLVFCQCILMINADILPIAIKGEKSRTVLFDACRLAKQLKMLGEEIRWKVISKVWLELMSYAAVRCSPRSHVAQLNKGGELITFVWLIMAHLGFGKCFQQVHGFRWSRLIVHK